MANSKLSADCAICCTNFTRVKRAPVTCKKCGFRACRECLKKYILNQESLTQIHCMIPECDCIWDRAFLAETLTQIFMRKRYPQRRGELLFQHELSRFPETMPYVEKHKKINKIMAERSALRIQIRDIKQQYNTLRRCEDKMNMDIHKLKYNLLHTDYACKFNILNTNKMLIMLNN